MAGFLDLLSESDRDLVQLGSRRMRYPAGTVYETKDATPIVMVVESGLIRLFDATPDGRQASVVYLHPTDAYAALDEMLPVPPAQLQALTKATVLMLDSANLTGLVTRNIGVSEAMIRIMGRTIGHLHRIVTVRSLGSMSERLAFDLLERASESQLREGDLVCHVTHDQLADSIGSSREVVSRMVGDLRRRGLVATSPRQIRVLAPLRLSAIVRGVTGYDGPSRLIA